jgi:hypothetical protein
MAMVISKMSARLTDSMAFAQSVDTSLWSLPRQKEGKRSNCNNESRKKQILNDQYSVISSLARSRMAWPAPPWISAYDIFLRKKKREEEEEEDKNVKRKKKRKIKINK